MVTGLEHAPWSIKSFWGSVVQDHVYDLKSFYCSHNVVWKGSFACVGGRILYLITEKQVITLVILPRKPMEGVTKFARHHEQLCMLITLLLVFFKQYMYVKILH